MKKILLSLVTIATISFTSFGQAPEGFKYQAVVRDASSNPMTDQAVGMLLTIQQGSIGGTAVYQETFAPTTNNYGLVNLEIGTGTSTDDFSSIDWSNGPYFIETAVDVTGGTSYAVMGTSQLMSVPYALYAKTSGNGEGPQGDQGPQGPPGEDGQGGITNGGTGIEVTGDGTSGDPYIINNSQAGFQHYIGEIFGGGVIYHLWKDSLGIEHGLIINPNPLVNPDTDCSNGGWSNNYEPYLDPIMNYYVSQHDGHMRSLVIDSVYASLGITNMPETIAVNLNDGGYDDWYIPTGYEAVPFATNAYLFTQVLFEVYDIYINYIFTCYGGHGNSGVRKRLSRYGNWQLATLNSGCNTIHSIRKF